MGHVGAHRLLLALNILHQLLETCETRLHLVERIVHGLNLAGDLIELAVLHVLLGLHLRLQGLHVDGHLVDGVGALRDEILHDAHALVVGLLEAGYGVLQLLNLGLELHHLLVDGEGGGAAEKDGAEKSGGGEPDGSGGEVTFTGRIGHLDHVNHWAVYLPFFLLVSPRTGECARADRC